METCGDTMCRENNYRKKLESIGRAIKKDIDKIDPYIECNNNQKDYIFFRKPICFDLMSVDRELSNRPSKDNKTSCLNDIDKKAGVYIFIISDIDIIDKDEFDKVSKGSKTNEMYELVKDGEEYTLYIGKSKNLKSRIQEHFNDNADSTPYSLKLNTTQRKKLINEDNKLYVFLLKDPYGKESTIDIKNIIISSVESLLHNKLCPIVGTRRT